MSKSAGRIGRPRSPLFRALGKLDPPKEVEIGGRKFERTEILKHDSWAATAIYGSDAMKVVCKFNRQQSIFGASMRWLGRLLASREANMLRRLGDLPGIPAWSGPIRVEGRQLENAVGHAFVEGHPLGKDEPVGSEFFQRLRGLLDAIHERDVAYVDLHKRENVIVGDDGLPYLIDFQIGFSLPHKHIGRFEAARNVLRMLQEADRYHLEKHRLRHSKEDSEEALGRIQPSFIRLHRLVAQPFRTMRRNLLVLLGFRTGRGNSTSEHFAEDAVRREIAQVAAPAGSEREAA